MAFIMLIFKKVTIITFSETLSLGVIWKWDKCRKYGQNFVYVPK